MMITSVLVMPAALGFFQFALLPCCLIVPVVLAFSVFWIWMLVDCLQNEPSGTDKIVWVLVIFCLHLLGAILYFLLRYKKNRLPGSGPGTGPGIAS